MCKKIQFHLHGSLSTYRKEAGATERRFKPEVQSNFSGTATISLIKFNINSTSRQRRQRWPDGFVIDVTATRGSICFSVLKDWQHRKIMPTGKLVPIYAISSYANIFGTKLRQKSTSICTHTQRNNPLPAPPARIFVLNVHCCLEYFKATVQRVPSHPTVRIWNLGEPVLTKLTTEVNQTLLHASRDSPF